LKAYADFFVLPEALKPGRPSWFGFPILVKEDAPFKRTDIVTFLEDHKIATRMLFGGNLLRQPAYKDILCRRIGPLVNTDKVMNGLFWIGVYPGLSAEMLEYMQETFKLFFKTRNISV
jgi:CDP-6-deoxy-D-xylo-4-hexulose-3-dehydrase